MTRICKLDHCSLPVSGPRAEFCKPAHRAAFWRTSHVVAEPVVHPRAGKNARSGSQVSYRKAVELLAGWLEMVPPNPNAKITPEREAELILRGALSERQAERERARERTG